MSQFSGTTFVGDASFAVIGATLVYYDGPQIVTLTDDCGHKWVAVAIDAEHFGYPMLCVQITKENLDALVAGKADLRDVYLSHPPSDLRIIDLAMPGNDKYILEPIPALNPEWIPGSGLIFDAEESETLISHPPIRKH